MPWPGACGAAGPEVDRVIGPSAAFLSSARAGERARDRAPRAPRNAAALSCVPDTDVHARCAQFRRSLERPLASVRGEPKAWRRRERRHTFDSWWTPGV